MRFIIFFLIPRQDIYDVNALDLMKLGKSFGFSEPPHVPLDLTGTKRKKVKMDKAQKRFAKPYYPVYVMNDSFAGTESVRIAPTASAPKLRKMGGSGSK